MEKNNSKSALPNKSRSSKGLSSAGSLTGKSSRTLTSSSMESSNDRSLRSASSSASNSVDKEIAKKFPPVMTKDTLMKYNDFRLRFDMEEMKLSDSDHLSDEYSFEEEEGDSQDEELQRLVEESQGDRRRIQESDAARAKELEMNGALIPADDDDDIDSEEEKEIMKEIKSEIQKQVREEMKSELAIYQAKMEALEREVEGRPAGEGDTSTEAEAEADLIDPKMKEALDKMRKLDKVLAKWIKKEKQVKRDRILLERRLRSEIEAMKSDGREHKDVANNTQKFLALELPPHHNAGIVLTDDGTEEPVFATQLNESEYPYLRTRDGNQTKDKVSQQQDPDSMSAEDGESSQGTRSVDGERKHRRRRGKNFIKRNKELAANADDIIAMTEAEKKRLEELLKDVDNLPDDVDENDNKSESSYNSSQVAVHSGEGFQPDTDDMRSLAGIDNRLKELMLPEDYESIASSPRPDRTQPQHKLFTRVAVTSSMDFEHFGEKALLENKEQRDFNCRLKQIEEELKKFHNPEELELETPTLGEDELQDLLDQCARSLSQSMMGSSAMGSSTMGSSMSFADSESRSGTATDNRSIISVESTPRSPRSARQWLMENPPKLSQDVLQKLLAEAYCPISKQLSTLNEEEEETMEKEVEANDNMQSIAAETWKLISQEKSDMNFDMSTIQHEIDNILKEPTHSGLHNGATNDRLRESFESQIPSLPEIDPTGTLVTQGLNNQKSGSRPSSTSSMKPQIEMIQNSLTESKIINQGYVNESLEILSIDGDSRSCTPRPPSSDKRQSSASSSRSRTVTPVNKSGT
ncbi:hypothetical protein CHS0354_032928 [Potamilus streckersoni]|uniref:Fibrous sheath-interacting protein 1 n=1 Tax=Potamilus streckersoni TaxID=2493646 RepID=A0AAE0RWD2_9BIVA|nr:hypothetical protein CHS0354_032928 [Potamilus streckersoni]